MKQYPSIPAEIQLGLSMIAFDKLDGSNVRAEWTKKNGFSKFGSRTRLVGADEKPLGECIELIKNTYEKDLSDIFNKQRYEKTTCYFEFLGPNSKFGNHADEPHEVTLIDVDVFKKGMLPARDFVKQFGHLKIPGVLYDGTINATFLEQVRNGTLPGMTFEGVICKGPFERKLGMSVMYKVKNQAWYAALREHCKNDDKLYDSLV